MRVTICDDKKSVASNAAQLGIREIQQAVETNGKAVIALSTGLSQIDMLASLSKADIPWEKIEVFHLDEYVGLSADHKASFRRYLDENFCSRVAHLGHFYAIHGDSTDIPGEVLRLNTLLADKSIDVAFLGIGENGHIAFNDPPADFDNTNPFTVVTLEQRCLRQQVNEGWFEKEEDVPKRAITMTIRQILKSHHIIACVPEVRKARAVAMCLFDQISSYAPCTVLRGRTNCDLFLDRPSATLVFGDRR